MTAPVRRAPLVPRPASKPPAAAPTTKAVTEPPVPQTPAEQAKQAMRTVNGSLQALSAINKSGWRAVPAASTAPPPVSAAGARQPSLKPSSSSSSLASASKDAATKTKATEAALACGGALADLRDLARSGAINNRPTDIEKGAASLVASLVEVGLYLPALRELVAMRVSILSWWTPLADILPIPTPQPPPKTPLLKAAPRVLADVLSFAPLVSLPLPPTSFFDPPTLVETLDPSFSRPPAEDVIPLVLAVQQYALGCLFRAPLSPADSARRPGVLAPLLAEESRCHPVAWRNLLGTLTEAGIVRRADAEPVLKKADMTMSSMFATLTNGCVGADDVARPEILFAVRSAALFIYATTRAVYSAQDKLDSFYDHTRKVLLKYGRQAEEQKVSPLAIKDAVKGVFDRILAVLAAKDATREGKTWVSLCEVVLRIASMAKDLPMVERVSLLIAAKAGSASKVDPELQVSQLCAKLAKAKSIFDAFFKTGEDNGVLEQVRRTMSIVPVLSRLRTQTLSSTSYRKIDKILDGIQYITVRHLKAGRRLDVLMTPASQAKPPVSEIESELFALLECMAIHVETLHKAFSSDPPPPSEMLEGKLLIYRDTFEVLTMLAYCRLVVDDRLSYTPAFASLERCLNLFRATMVSNVIEGLDIVDHYSLRSVASAYYNIGGALFNASKPEAAVRFARRAAEMSSATVRTWERRGEGSQEPTAGMEDSISDMRKHLSRRYELVALAHYGVGDKAAAHEAFVCAILSQPAEILATLESSLRTAPVSAILVREASLFRLVQRATKLATFDLLLPGPTVCLRDRLFDAGHSNGVCAAVVELQVAATDGSLDRAEAMGAVAAMLEALLQLYTPAQFPMKRARALVRRMQHQCDLSTITLDLSAAAAAAEIDSLCTQESHGDDASLVSFAPQYLAMSHLWLAFHAHQGRQPSASESTLTEARQALRILRQALDTELPPSPSGPKRSPMKAAPSPKEKIARKVGGTVKKAPAARVATTSAFKTPQVSRTLAGRSQTNTIVDLVTPPSRQTFDLGDKSPARRGKGETDPLVLDDADKCYAILESMANLLGALGFTLLRISYLKFLRRLAAKTGAKGPGAFVTTSAYLGDEYTRLGKTSRAGLVFSQADARLQIAAKAGTPVPDQAHVMYLIFYAGYLASLGNHERSATAYSEAIAIAEMCGLEDTSLPSALRIVERTLRLERTASASTICSVMLQRKGDLTRSLRPAMQALRLWMRALSNISRLSSAPAPERSATSSTAADDDLFNPPKTNLKAPFAEVPPGPEERQKTPRLRWPNNGIAWRLVDGLARAMLRVATLHSIRGTPKSAEYYADQALGFADDVGSSRLSARALVARADVRVHVGNFDGADEDLGRIEGILGPTSSCPEAIEARRLRADLSMKTSSEAEAHELYLQAQKELDAFVIAAAEGEPVLSSAVQASPMRHKVLSPSPSRGGSEQLDCILPAIQAYLFRVRVGLLRTENKQDESQALLSRLSKLAITEDDQAAEFKLLASIQFQDLLIRFGTDPVLSMLPDSVLSIPTLSLTIAKGPTPRSAPSLLGGLREIESLLARAVSLSVSRSNPAKLRDLSLLTASHRAMHSSAGKLSKRSAATVASTLDLGLAVTLRREMLDAIDSKIAGRSTQDDLIFPTLDGTASLSAPGDESAMTQYWTSLRERYRVESAEASLTDTALSTLLPASWSVLSIHVTMERDCLILVRHRLDSEPLVFKLPLDRVARREDDDEGLTFDLVLGELRDIIKASNDSTGRAKNIEGKEARAGWWKERTELDRRLRVLVEGVEDSWLAAFKAVFRDARHLSPEALATFKSRVERILKRSIVRSHERKVAKFKLDDDILNCLAALPPTARDEDFEDLFYFIMESLQFTGVPIAIDEIDVDQVAVDLRSAVEELHLGTTPTTGDHTFLLLDKSLQSFPWESIPCLRGRSVSRLPSLAFLRDRMDLAALRQGSPDQHPCEVIVDSSKTTFVLNPSGDLKNTQSRFEPWLDSMKASGWSGIIGRAPWDEELKAALSTQELFLYFGHGGAEQYIRSQTVRNLPQCAVTMLWGCSSGLLKDLGDYDPVGTPYHYMIAGCPALVANLWDVTDKDIDLLSETVFRKLLLEPGGPPPETSDDPRPSLTEAVATSRDVCVLPYLNGAATVVYGCPVRFV